MQRYQLFATDICPKGIAIQMHKTISNVPSIGCDFLKDQFGLLQVTYLFEFYIPIWVIYLTISHFSILYS